MKGIQLIFLNFKIQIFTGSDIYTIFYFAPVFNISETGSNSEDESSN